MTGLQPWVLGAAALFFLLLEAGTLSGISGLVAFALLLVGLIDLFFGGGSWASSSFTLATQAALCALLFLGSAVPWVRWRRRRSVAGSETSGDPETLLHDAPEGEVATVGEGGRSGRVQLDRAFLGERAWLFSADHPLAAGQRVHIVAIDGNKLRVDGAERARDDDGG